MISAEEYLNLVKKECLEIGNPETAEKQMKYLRNQFAYYGLKAPIFGALFKRLFKEHGYLQGEALKTLVELCFEQEYREVHYFAVEMVQKVLKKQEKEFMELLEFMIRNQSWWDTVDWLAKLVGIHFKRYPELILPVTKRWMASEEMWLQRVCIIFQLFYKEKTDEQLMYRYILEVADSKEFFLQKAAGWALRQYSKTKPESVIDFIETHQLAPLTKREGLRLILSKK